MRVAYLCNTFGQPDHDRCAAMTRAGLTVQSFDWARADTEYRWENTTKDWAGHHLIPVGGKGASSLAGLVRLISGLLSARPQVAIIYGYHNRAFFLAAILLRLIGVSSVTMNDSRFSDYSRTLPKDVLKAIMLLPYRGCLAASRAAAHYAHFLGLRRVEVYHCAVDVKRIAAGSAAAFQQTAFADRAFLVVSRFVEKKNLARLLDAYERYLEQAGAPRNLRLVGYGPMEAEIRDRVAASPLLSRHVEIVGFVTVSRVPEYIGSALCLVLPSLSDQFGIVVTEALACGVPAIVSSNCGAADLVHSWGNGHVVDPEQTDSLSRALIAIDTDEATWRGLSDAARVSADEADVAVFLSGLKSLLPPRLQSLWPA
ncbi:glycosyltransferase [Rhizobium sp. CRIBSB]|nr:glycosyltransferase [Rhizobium sp. CRIBSB]